jgi:S1-C subfamily serine protease
MDDFNESQGTTGDSEPDNSMWMPPPPASPGDAGGWGPPTPNPPGQAESGPAEPQQGGWAPPPPAWGASPPGWHHPGAAAGSSQENGGWGASYQDPNGWGDPWASGPQGNPYATDSGSWGNTNPPPPGAGPGWAGGAAGGPANPPGGWNYPWQNQSSPQPRRTLPGAITALLLAVAVLVGLGIGHGVWRTAQPAGLSTGNGGSNSGGIFQNPFGGNSGSGSGSGSGGSASNGSTPANVGSIAAKVAPALVDVNTALSYEHGEAAGTGIVLTSDGIVLTNNHVIAGATSVSVTDVGNGHTYPGTVLGYDRIHDIAVIQLQSASGLQAASIGNSGKVSVGDEVVGMGNAGGAGGTPSSAAGTVTALNQSITADDESNGTSEQLTGLIQTNANIQPGDSGGALVNASGQVVGMDTAASSSFQFQNSSNDQGFAIPINQALSIAGQIRAGQASDDVHIGPTAFLGVLVSTTGSNSGATLSSVVSGGPAANAGLTGGDTITTVGGKTVSSPSNLTTIISRYAPGDKVSVSWVDSSGSSHQATVQLVSGPPQ